MVKIDFGGVKEDVITRKEFTVQMAQKILKKHVSRSDEAGWGIDSFAKGNSVTGCFWSMVPPL